MKTQSKKTASLFDFGTLIALFLLIWIFMFAFFPAYYYFNHAVPVSATVVAREYNEETTKCDVYVSYEYKDILHENVFYHSFHITRAPDKDMIIDIKVNESKSGEPITPIEAMLDNISLKTDMAALIISIVLLLLRVGSVCKIANKDEIVTMEWVVGYVRRKEAFRMILATFAVFINFFFTRNKTFVIVFAIAIYLIATAVIRILKTYRAGVSFHAMLATCLKKSKEAGGENLKYIIETDLETFSGASKEYVMFYSAIGEGDKILIVSFSGSNDYYMLLAIPNGTPYQLEKYTCKSEKNSRIIKLMHFALVSVLVLLVAVNYGKCNHKYNEFYRREPTSESEGAVEYGCSKCYDTNYETIPKLEACFEISIANKFIRYLEQEEIKIEIEGITYPFTQNPNFYIDYDTVISNTSNRTVEKAEVIVNLVDLDGEIIDKIFITITEPLPAGEKTTLTKSVYHFANGMFSDPMLVNKLDGMIKIEYVVTEISFAE